MACMFGRKRFFFEKKNQKTFGFWVGDAGVEDFAEGCCRRVAGGGGAMNDSAGLLDRVAKDEMNMLAWMLRDRKDRAGFPCGIGMLLCASLDPVAGLRLRGEIDGWRRLRRWIDKLPTWQ